MERFDGTLGERRTEPVSFDLEEGVKPNHHRSFSVPQIHKEVKKKDLHSLCHLGGTRVSANINELHPHL